MTISKTLINDLKDKVFSDKRDLARYRLIQELVIDREDGETREEYLIRLWNIFLDGGYKKSPKLFSELCWVLGAEGMPTPPFCDKKTRPEMIKTAQIRTYNEITALLNKLEDTKQEPKP